MRLLRRCVGTAERFMYHSSHRHSHCLRNNIGRGEPGKRGGHGQSCGGEKSPLKVILDEKNISIYKHTHQDFDEKTY